MKALVASLAGVDIAEAMTQAVAAPAAAAAAPAAAGGADAPAAKKQKRKRKKRKAALTVLARSLVEQGPIAAESHTG